MPLEDQIIPDEKQGTNQGDFLHNFLDSAQTILAESVAKSAAEKVVDGMFSPGQQGASQSGQPHQDGLYPDLNQDEKRNKDPSFIDTAQNAFADAFAKKAAEKVVDGILPSNNRQPISNHGPNNQGQSGFDLGNLGSSLLESLADQVLHSSDKQSPQQQNMRQHVQGEGREQQSFDLGNELLGLAGQFLHSQNQKEQIPSKPQQAQGENQSGFDFGKVGSELLGSLAEQVLHPDKKVAAEQQNSNVHQNQQENQSGFDFSKVGAELLGSLAEQVLHPADKKENTSVQQQTTEQHRNSSNQQGSGDIGSILGSLAENVLGGAKHNQESHGAPSRQNTLAESAEELASSVLSSLAESMLHRNTNDGQQQNQGQPPQWYGPDPRGFDYGPGPQGYGPGPQGYGPGPQGYGPGPQGYGPGPQGYGSGPQGYGPGFQGYGPGPQGYRPGPQGNWPGARGLGPLSQGEMLDSQGGRPANPREAPLTEDIWSFSHHDRQKNAQKQQHEDEQSAAAELGSFLVKSLASKVLEPRQ